MTEGLRDEPAIEYRNTLPDAPHVSAAIVGAGACGLTAGLRLREAGVDCVVIERDHRPGGSTALSSGFIPAASTAVQRALGISDSVTGFMRDIQAKAHGGAASHLVEAYAHGIVAALDALSARHGIAFEVLDGFLYPGHGARRMHAVPEHTGAALVTRLEQACAATDVDVLCDACVQTLYVNDNDRVIGLAYVRPDCTTATLACNTLLLACNGFGGNRAMVRDLLPEMAEAIYGGHTGNDGSAIAWARELGAGLADLGGYQGHGSWAVPQNTLISWALIMEGGVQINARGQRFHDETQGYSEAAVQVLAQPGGIAWNVIDGPLLDLARTFPEFREAEAAGAVKSADSLQALAELIACPIAQLRETFAQMAPGRANQVSASAAGRNKAGPRVFQRILRPPFHAIKITGALFHTQGGLDIDAHCRVRTHGGAAFPNLFAAGGAARGVSGNAVWGYLSGNGLLSAVAGGWIAAETIAQQLAQEPGYGS